MTKMRWIIILLISLLCSSLLFGCSSAASGNDLIKNGVLDLSAGHVKNDIVSLDGEWAFYWRKFVQYTECQEYKPDLFVRVPKAWTFYTLNGRKLAGKGFATYRLHVKTSKPAGSIMAVKLFTFSSDYDFFINDRLIASNGSPGTSKKEEIPEYRPKMVSFAIPDSSFDIIIHVSNYHYSHGGFWNTAYIGDANDMILFNNQKMLEYGSVLGALFLAALFFFVTYLINKELLNTLLLSLLCLCLITIIDVNGEMTLFGYFDGLSFRQIIWIWYTCIFGTLLFLALYVGSLFPSKFSKIIIKILLIYFILAESLFTLTGPECFCNLAYIGNFIDLLFFLCIVIAVLLRVIKRQKKAGLYLAALIITLATYIYYVLEITNRLRTELLFVVPLGLSLVLVIHMLILAKQIKNLRHTAVKAELAFLRSQIKPHFLYNVLNTIISISRYNPDKSRDILIDYTRYLRNCFDIMENTQFTPLTNELEYVRSYVSIEKARFEDRLEVSFDIPDRLDYEVPVLVLQPIVENAILHGVLPKEDGGHVEIHMKESGHYLEFAVLDDGVGFDATKPRREDNPERGAHVGIHNIDLRLKKLYGEGLVIESSSLGTKVSWKILINSGKHIRQWRQR